MKKLVLSLMVLFAVAANVLAVNVKDSGVKGDGKTDDTAAVQAVLDSGATEVYFPDGTYLLGSLKIPGDMTIRFAPKAKYKINPVNLPHDPKKPKDKRLIILSGNNITLDGFNFDFTGPDGKELGEKEVRTLIYGEGFNNLRVLNLRALKKSHYGKVNGPDDHPWMKGIPAPPGGGWMGVVQLKNCKDVELARCNISYMSWLLGATYCENVSAHENRAEWTHHISTFGIGCKQLRHYANWSRNVTFQCVWWGGNPGIKDDRMNVVRPDLKPGDEGYDNQCVGVYDISVQNNYAEYGTTLAWGAKARNVLIDGNIAKYMQDMAYDSEGDENIVISNNISINSAQAGIGCYFWTDRVQITGNLIMNLNEGDDMHKGMFIRLHSGGQPPHRSGTGKAFISGNHFVSEISNKKHHTTLNRLIQIEDCRDVTINGNKFVNGWIRTAPWCRSGKITIMNNEFDNSLAGNGPAIRIDSKGTEAIIRNNIIRKSAAEDNPLFKDAAIHILADQDKQIIVEGNLIDGWRNSISCKPKNPTGKPSRYIIRNNTISGSIDFLGLEEQFRKHDLGNLNPKTLRPVKVKYIPEKNFKDEKYKM